MNKEIYTPLPNYMKNVTDVRKATTQQYKWLYEHRCCHRHRYATHFNCFIQDYDIHEKIAYLDTEFYVGKNNWGRLAGDWGFILCWVIGDGEGNYAHDIITPKEVFSVQDKRIIQSCVDELKKYDRVITQYGDRADIPLLRTRAAQHKLKFFDYGELWTTDLWKIAKNKLCLSSNSQKNISELFFGDTEKTRVEPKLWLAAVRGDKKALDEILDHCKRDVRDLERNAKKLLPYIKLTRRSI